MASWRGSTRRRRLPADWRKRRKLVIERAGGRCEHVDHTGARCWKPGVEVDHIEPGDDHHLDNLQALCHEHHAAKTAREARQARDARAAARRRGVVA